MSEDITWCQPPLPDAPKPLDWWHLYGNSGCRHENEDAANVAIEQSQGSACDCTEFEAHDAADLVTRLRTQWVDFPEGVEALLEEAAYTIDQQIPLATAGRILLRFASEDGEWWDLSDRDLQIDGTVDITPAEAEILRRLTT